MDTNNLLFANRYRLLPRPREWDEGKSGIVLPAEDTWNQNKRVVIKYAVPDEIHKKAQISNLEHEADALKRLKSKFIPQYIDSGYTNRPVKTFYVAMEEVIGVRVENWIEKKEYISFRERIQILAQFYLLLTQAHKLGLMNRDVDIKHLFWQREAERLIVIDWGNAKFQDNYKSSAEDISRSNAIVYSLLTQDKTSQGQVLTLPEPASIVGLNTIPYEYYELIKWAPQASAFPKKGIPPINAEQLYKASHRWFQEYEITLDKKIDRWASEWINLSRKHKREILSLQNTINDVYQDALSRPFLKITYDATTNYQLFQDLEKKVVLFKEHCALKRWDEAATIVNQNKEYLQSHSKSLLFQILSNLGTKQLQNLHKYDLEIISISYEQLIADSFIATNEEQDLIFLGQFFIEVIAKKLGMHFLSHFVEYKTIFDNIYALQKKLEYFSKYDPDNDSNEAFAKRIFVPKVLKFIDAWLNDHERLTMLDRNTPIQAIIDIYNALLKELRTRSEDETFLELHAQIQTILIKIEDIISHLTGGKNNLDRIAESYVEEEGYFQLMEAIHNFQSAWLLDNNFYIFRLWQDCVSKLAFIHSLFFSRICGYRSCKSLENELSKIAFSTENNISYVNKTSKNVLTNIPDIFPPFWEENGQLREFVYLLDLCSRNHKSTLSVRLQNNALASSKILAKSINKDLSQEPINSLEVREINNLPQSNVSDILPINENQITAKNTQEAIVADLLEIDSSIDSQDDNSNRRKSAISPIKGKHSNSKWFYLFFFMFGVIILAMLFTVLREVISPYDPTLPNQNLTPTIAEVAHIETTTQSPSPTPMPSATPTVHNTINTATIQPSPPPTQTVPPTTEANTTTVPIPETIANSLRTFRSGVDSTTRLVLIEPDLLRRQDRGFYNTGENNFIWYFKTFQQNELAEIDKNIIIESGIRADFATILNPGEKPNGIGFRGIILSDSLQDKGIGIFIRNDVGEREFIILQLDEDIWLAHKINTQIDLIENITKLLPPEDLSSMLIWVHVQVVDQEVQLFFASAPLLNPEEINLSYIGSIDDFGQINSLGLVGYGNGLAVLVNELRIHGTKE